MGRYHYGQGKDSIEDYPKTIDIKFLKKYGYLDKGVEYKKGGLYWKLGGKDNGNIGVEVNKGDVGGNVRVTFTQTSYNGEKKELDYQIPLVSTPCNYGGVRWWFLCPCKGNRCSILYLQSNGIFASRKTLDLCYDEQKKSKKWREFNTVFPNECKAGKIYETIKYKYRNGKPTRKYKSYLKIMRGDVPMGELLEMERKLLKG